ncbi:7-cyano-7-deazaguanine reductase [bacterium E08(2017)]|nr:7-cyano-7-deazaguanine reductase [bacterium E08(2017)]
MPTKKTKYDGITLLKQNDTNFPNSPSKAKLESFKNSHPKRPYTIEFDCPEFTCICPITGQPDFGHITLEYIPDKLCVESKSLKLYLHSYRNHGAFHEEVINKILDDVVKAINPREAIVTGEFNPRGGIAINVQAVYP